MAAVKHIDLIVPVRNEAANIAPLVERLNKTLKDKYQYKIIFIDDHSTDNTRQNIESLTSRYPIHYFEKLGKPGKAFSILEGAAHATSEYIAFIDGDLQYPPEILPQMLAMTDKHQVVIAHRKKLQISFLRQLLSRCFHYIFSRLLFGFSCDVQSGLKVFRRDILSHILATSITGWTLDLPLLTTATHLGYTIGEVDIEFQDRHSGESKINLLHSIFEIGGHALYHRLTLPDQF